jgi:hypothetical protein
MIRALRSDCGGLLHSLSRDVVAVERFPQRLLVKVMMPEETITSCRLLMAEFGVKALLAFRSRGV